MAYYGEGNPLNSGFDARYPGQTYTGGGGYRVPIKPSSTKYDEIKNLVFVTSPEETAYYNMARGNALRGIDASYAPQRTYALQALEARGLGRSSEVGRTLSSLAGSEGIASQQAISDIQGQQFAARQSRINAYLNYLYSKNLQKQAKSGSIFDYLGQLGSGIGDILSFGHRDTYQSPGGVTVKEPS